MTSASGAPGMIRVASSAIACSMRCNSSQPQAYVSGRSMLAPRCWRAERE